MAQEGTTQMHTKMRWVAGERTWVKNQNSWGTVLFDNGRDKFGDYGVLVNLDTDNETASCTHDQLHTEEGK